MSKKVKGILLGILASLAGIAIWVGSNQLYLYVSQEFGWLSYLGVLAMGGFFYLVYVKVNKEDKSWFPVILGSILMVIEVVIAYFLDLLIICRFDTSVLSIIMQIPEMKNAMLQDLGFGAVMMAVTITWLVMVHRNKKKNNSFADRVKQLNNQQQPSAETKKQDKCIYCDNIISAEDTKCPNCGGQIHK